jgi:hypothetical protein
VPCHAVKRYTFFESPGLAVAGRVDEYEPESVWVQVWSEESSRELLRRIVEGAEYAAFRLRQASVQRGAEPGAAPAADGGDSAAFPG